MSMAINDVIQARIVGQLHGQTTINTLCYVVRDANTTPEDVANDVAGNVVSFILLATCGDFQVLRVDTQVIDPLPRTFVTSVDVQANGSLPGQSIPSSSAVVIRKRTTFAGRKYRGRCYFAGVPTDNVVSSMLNASAQIAWKKVATAMLQGVGGIGQIPATPVLFAPHKGYSPLPQPLTATIVDPILRNQRRRQIGVGI